MHRYCVQNFAHNNNQQQFNFSFVVSIFSFTSQKKKKIEKYNNKINCLFQFTVFNYMKVIL